MRLTTLSLSLHLHKIIVQISEIEAKTHRSVERALTQLEHQTKKIN